MNIYLRKTKKWSKMTFLGHSPTSCSRAYCPVIAVNCTIIWTCLLMSFFPSADFVIDNVKLC